MPDTEITFDSGAVTYYGSLRTPPTTRTGRRPPRCCSPAVVPPTATATAPCSPGDIGTLRHLADVLEQHGISSLRYDKIGSGETALGPYEVEEVGGLGFTTFVDARPRASTSWPPNPGSTRRS